MTDNVRGSSGPPWSVDLLADLHAGVLDAEESERLWPQVNADPEARAVLEALDSVKVDLGQWGQAPVEPMPQRYAAQLDAALATEMRAMRARGPVATQTAAAQPTAQPPAPPTAPVIDLAAARKRRNRMAAWGAGVLTAAAAVAAIAFIAIPSSNTTDGTAQPGDEPTQTEEPGSADAAPPLALNGDNLNPAIEALTGEKDYGALEDEAGLQECLSSHEVDAAGDTIGVSPVMFDGKEAIAALFGAGLGKFELVVVTPSCEEKLADSTLPS